MLACFRDARGFLRFNQSHALVHNRVAERKLGRRLRKGEYVQHKNHIITDNRPENLEIIQIRPKHTKWITFDLGYGYKG